MADNDEILFDNNHDGIDRRGFLKCMAWAGTGALCIMSGGVMKSYGLGSPLAHKHGKGELSFVQISDSHMGFNKPANPDVAATLKIAVGKINALPIAPEFMLHTGDISHLSKQDEFDNVDQILKSAKPKDVYFVPGEHDVLEEDGKTYRDRYGRNAKGDGWYSFDQKGVHFIGLVNVMNLKPGGLGTLGHDQLEWLEDDVKPLSQVRPSLCSRIFRCGRSIPVGMGHGRQRAGAFLPEAFRFGVGAERTSTRPCKGRGQRDVSHCLFDGFSAT